MSYKNLITIFLMLILYVSIKCVCVFVVVCKACQRGEGVRSISVVNVCMCPEKGQKGTSNRKASRALPGQGLLETDFTRPSVQKKPSFW